MFKNQQNVAVLYVYSANTEITDTLILRSVADFLKGHEPLGEDAVCVSRTSKGKPFVSGVGGIFVSATHSGDYCIIAVSQSDIGVDLQTHDRLRLETEDEARLRYLKLAKRFFHPKEHSYVQADPLNRFFEVWCAKESYVKCTGEGIDDNFWTYSVVSDAETPLAGSVEWSEGWFNFIPFKDGYTLCLFSVGEVSTELVFK